MKLTEDQKNELMNNGKFTKEQVDLLSDNEIDYNDIKKHQSELMEDMPGSPIKDINIEVMAYFIRNNDELNTAFIEEVNSLSGGSKRKRRKNRKTRKIGKSGKSTRRRHKKTKKTNRRRY